MALVRKPKPAVKIEYNPHAGPHESEVEETSNEVIDVDALPAAVTTVPIVMTVQDNSAEES